MMMPSSVTWECLRAKVPAHGLLPELDALFAQGSAFKRGAMATMQDGGACLFAMDDVKEFLGKLRSNAKAAGALVEAKRQVEDKKSKRK